MVDSVTNLVGKCVSNKKATLFCSNHLFGFEAKDKKGWIKRVSPVDAMNSLFMFGLVENSSSIYDKDDIIGCYTA